MNEPIYLKADINISSSIENICAKNECHVSRKFKCVYLKFKMKQNVPVAFGYISRVSLSDNLGKAMYYFNVESLISTFCMTGYYISFVLIFS